MNEADRRIIMNLHTEFTTERERVEIMNSVNQCEDYERRLIYINGKLAGLSRVLGEFLYKGR